MHRLIQLSNEIDADELSPCVSKFVAVKEKPAEAPSLHATLSALKQSTKNTKTPPFLAVLLESLAVFSDFSSVDGAVKKEMLQATGESVQFYLNRILKEAKEGNEAGKIEWVKEFKAVFDECLSHQLNTISESTKKQLTESKGKSDSGAVKAELKGNIWYLQEVSKRDTPIEVEITSMQQRLVISKCSECVVKVVGKCTAISVEQATRVGLLLTDPVVSTVEVLNSTRCQVQIQQACPTLTVDNCEGVQIFLGRGVEKQFELLTCKSNEVNLYRSTGDDGEFSGEVAVPEQFKSFFDGEGRLITEPVKHAGA